MAIPSLSSFTVLGGLYGRTRKPAAHTIHARKIHPPPPSPAPLAATRAPGAAEIRERAAGASDRGRHRDPAAVPDAYEPRLCCDPQADRTVRLCRSSARQGTVRDLAQLWAAVSHLFHQCDPAGAIGRAGADREFRKPGRPHLLALAMEFQDRKS